jgi:Bacteriodetes cell division protein (FtsL-like)
MEENKDIQEFVDPKVESKEHKKTSLKELIDGSIITRKAITQQLPFILFISFLAVLYIGNRYHAEKIVRKIDKLQVEVQDLRAESIITASELMFISKQSEVLKMVNHQNINIKESVEPPIMIKK